MARAGKSVNYVSGEAIPPRRCIKFGSADGVVMLATAPTDLIIGVSELGCTAAGDHLDIIRDDFAKVEYGGTVTRGQALTADSIGRAIVAAPATGVNHRVIGFAEVSGVVSDIGELHISPNHIQG